MTQMSEEERPETKEERPEIEALSELSFAHLLHGLFMTSEGLETRLRGLRESIRPDAITNPATKIEIIEVRHKLDAIDSYLAEVDWAWEVLHFPGVSRTAK